MDIESTRLVYIQVVYSPGRSAYVTDQTNISMLGPPRAYFKSMLTNRVVRTDSCSHTTRKTSLQIDSSYPIVVRFLAHSSTRFLAQIEAINKSAGFHDK